MRKNAIITSSDKKFGNFVLRHWFRSLKDNVNLKNIDVVVLDYGLSIFTRTSLKKQGVNVIKCKKDGQVGVVRFRDIGNFLANNDYDQVMVTDGGDIIFQDDISGLFDQDKNTFRLAFDDFYHDLPMALARGCIKPEIISDIKEVLKKKKQMNVGVMLGPAKKFRALCTDFMSLLTSYDRYGPDQVGIPYLLYKKFGVIDLDRRYNFQMFLANFDFYIQEGVFYAFDGSKIPVVHNNGHIRFTRFIADFGYGKDHNRVKVFRQKTAKLMVRIMFLLGFLRKDYG